MPISPSDQDLAELAAASQLDKTLSALAGLASVGARHMLGLLVNGMTVYGRAESPGAVFAELDAENARMIERARATGASGWHDEAVEEIEGQWTRAFEEDEREDRELMERAEGKDLDDMPEPDIREAIEHRMTTMTLADVNVFRRGSPRFDVPVMRVRIAQVARGG